MSGLVFPGLAVERDRGVQNMEEKTAEKAVESHWWIIMKKKAFVLWLAVAFLFGLIEYVPLILVVSAGITFLIIPYTQH